MDEILIEDKKYISSKRAAKITGYAKDYIGQLCREGRVPARLVGRSWYVLETAIQDHRFGNQEIAQEKSIETPTLDQQVPESTKIPSTTWESPRYEASSTDILPTVNRLQEEKIEAFTDDKEEIKISDSWKEWFDRIAEAEEIVPVVKKPETNEEETVTIEDKEIEEHVEEEKPVEIPIHAVYRQPPQELLPHISSKLEQSQEQSLPTYSTEKRRNRVPIIKAIQICSLAIAIITTTLAILGSGYLDKYIISISPVNIIAGAVLYNK